MPRVGRGSGWPQSASPTPPIPGRRRTASGNLQQGDTVGIKGIKPVLWIRICFNATPDAAFLVNADPGFG
jgi:hypothetical protein